MKNFKPNFKSLPLLLFAVPLMVMNGQLKETFSLKDRNQLLKMATFGPTAEMVLDLNNSNTNNDVADEIEWLDYQLNHPSAYDDPNDEWLSHFQRVEQIATTHEPLSLIHI